MPSFLLCMFRFIDCRSRHKAPSRFCVSFNPRAVNFTSPRHACPCTAFLRVRMSARRVYAFMFSRVVCSTHSVPIARSARQSAGSPAEGENRKSCLQPRVAWNETAGTRLLRGANMDQSPNMVCSCQCHSRQIPPSCCAQASRARHARRVCVHVCRTFPASLYRVSRHAPQVSRVCFPMAFLFSFLDLLFFVAKFFLRYYYTIFLT